jgi:Na+/melibiose symporter-like transporter
MKFEHYVHILALALFFMCLGMIIILIIVIILDYAFGMKWTMLSSFAIPIGGLIGVYFLGRLLQSSQHGNF